MPATQPRGRRLAGDPAPWEAACRRRHFSLYSSYSPILPQQRSPYAWGMFKRGSSQLRKGRYSESGRIYLLTSVTQDRRRLFSDFRASRILIRELIREHRREELISLAFVVMPDHLHWLVEQQGEGNLSTCMRRTKSLSARNLNHYVGAGGRVWQDGFHDHALRRDEDLINFARYVIANPLRAGLVRSLRHYPHWDAIWA